MLWLSMAMLMGCGPAWSGKVSGYGLETREAVFTTLTVGTELSAVLVLGDQPNLCSQLAAPRAPGDATLAAFSFGRRADGKALTPDTGDYVVTDSRPASGTWLVGQFVHTDANGTNAIPSANARALSGLLKVTKYTPNGQLLAEFDGRFGSQGDEVQTAISASWCSITSDALRQGFLFKGASSSDGPGGSTSSDCRAYLSCLESISPGSSGQLESSYGAGGTCWTSTSSVADACSNACREGLASARSSFPNSSACNN